MSANLTNVKVIEAKDMMSDRRYIAVVFHLSDGAHKYMKCYLPIETTGLIAGLRQLADEIQKEYHKG